MDLTLQVPASGLAPLLAMEAIAEFKQPVEIVKGETPEKDPVFWVWWHDDHGLAPAGIARDYINANL